MANPTVLRATIAGLVVYATFSACANTGNPIPYPGGQPGDNTGWAVSIHGGDLLAGTPGDDSLNLNAGKALVYRLSGTNWIVDSGLYPSTPAFNGRFGWWVEHDSSRAIVGAFGETVPGFITGSAYIYEQAGSSWTEVARMTGEPTVPEDGFGTRVTISGDYAAVSAPLPAPPTFTGPGVVYVFKRGPDGIWEQDTILTASDSLNGAEFGSAVSMDGDVLVVGSKRDNDVGQGSGSAYVFRRQGSTWVEEDKLLAFDGGVGDHFGYAVGVSGDVAVVGARFEADLGDSAGAAYVFEWNGGTSTWDATSKLLAFDGDAHDQYGYAVSVDGLRIVIGAWLADGSVGTSGAAYTYRKNVAGTWPLTQKLVADTAAFGDGFGFSVDVSEDCAAVGAPNRDRNGDEKVGATYVFCDLPDAAVDPGFELDIICCVVPPDPLGPVVFNARFANRSSERRILRRRIELDGPDGSVQVIDDGQTFVLTPEETFEERGVLPLTPRSPAGPYNIVVYLRGADGVRIRSAIYQHRERAVAR